MQILFKNHISTQYIISIQHKKMNYSSDISRVYIEGPFGSSSQLNMFKSSF